MVTAVSSRLHGKDLGDVAGLTYRKAYHVRDVDYYACIRLLVKYGADPRLQSASGAIPIFEAIKEDDLVVQALLDYDEHRSETVNQLNNDGKSPLCVLADQPFNMSICRILVANGASQEVAMPKYHPYKMAMDAKNIELANFLTASEAEEKTRNKRDRT